MNTGTIRIAIVVALVAVGALVLTNGFADTGSAAGPPAGGSSPSPTDSSSPTATNTPPPAVPGIATRDPHGDDARRVAAGIHDAGGGSSIRSRSPRNRS